MPDLVKALAERKVNELAYVGMRALAKYLSERLGLDLFSREEDLARASRIIEVRNVVVHNGAVVNQVFLSRLPDSPAKLGDQLLFEMATVEEDMKFLMETVTDIDERAAVKFELPRRGRKPGGNTSEAKPSE